ncbi:MAG TPA: phospholipid carrier-dependent glycosyltransferase, partial [Polyangiales bacterium]|nr:phospholipid carrier-dependent glycosyltransferase [Polyangiales bacterium]
MLLIGAGLTRSWIATSKDSPQIDEAWHVIAGVSYARTGDYRLNPEHPPLVKLWVGATMPERTCKFPEFRRLEDKGGEREFIDQIFYLDNDPHMLQRQVRLSMLAFHGLALLALAWALRRNFGPVLALATIALLLLDPTVAAHLPVVLTDLPLALLSSTAILLAFVAFRAWRPLDLVVASLALGLALSSKHSAIPVGLAVLGLGIAAALAPGGRLQRAGLVKRLGALSAVLLGSVAVLWAFYGFHFEESPHAAVSAATATHAPSSGESLATTFNRPFEDKLADLQSATHRAVLGTVADLKLLPRAYLWGLADIIRVGVDGRQDTMYVFGKLIHGNTPWYFFPAVLLAKL